MPQFDSLDAATENPEAGAREASVTISVNKDATLRHTRIHRLPFNFANSCNQTNNTMLLDSPAFVGRLLNAFSL